MAESEKVIQSDSDGEGDNDDRMNFDINNDTLHSAVNSPPKKIIRLDDFIADYEIKKKSYSKARTTEGEIFDFIHEIEEGEIMTSRSTTPEKADSEPGNSKSLGFSQAMTSESALISNDEDDSEEIQMITSSSSSSDEEGEHQSEPPLFRSIIDEDLAFPCAYRKFGCTRTFLYPLEFKQHVRSQCKFSVFYNCRDQQCRGTSKGKFQSLHNLVKHTTQHHRVPNVLEEDGVSSFNVTRDFFAAPTQGDVNVKIIGDAEISDNGEEYRVAFFLMSSWQGRKDDRVYLIPVLHGQGELMDHFISIKCSVRGSGKETLVPITGLKHHNIGFCFGIGSPERFFNDMKILDVLSYDKKKFMDKGRTGINDRLEYDLHIELEPYRVRIMRESGFEPRKYSLTIPQLKLDEGIQQDLIATENATKLLLIAQVLIPQLYGDADLIVETNDEQGIFATFTSALMSYAIKTREKNHTGPQHCTGILMFPTSNLLKKAELTWKKKAAKFGVLVSSLPSDDEVIIDKLQLHGAEILLTTPIALLKAIEKKTDLLSSGLLSKLNFVIVTDADYICLRSETRNALKDCMARIESSANKNLVRVAVSPVVNQNLVSLLYTHGFSYSCNIFSVGIKPDASISRMEMNMKFANRIFYKRQAVLQILGKHSNEPNRWLILAVEDTVHCPGHLKALIKDLRLVYQNRVSSVETEEEMEANPNAFDPFLTNPKGILITGYFALANDKIKIGPNVLMHTLPFSKADLRRVAELVVDSEDPNLFYGLNDPYSHNFFFERDFFCKD